MIRLVDAIVGFWFLPVTLFIILPLTMLCGWAVFKLFFPPKPMTAKDQASEKKQLDDVIVLTEGS